MATLAPRNETNRIATPIRMVRKRMASGRIDPRVPGGFGVGALLVGTMLVEGRPPRQREPAIYQRRLCRNCGQHPAMTQRAPRLHLSWPDLFRPSRLGWHGCASPSGVAGTSPAM